MRRVSYRRVCCSVLQCVAVCVVQIERCHNNEPCLLQMSHVSYICVVDLPSTFKVDRRKGAQRLRRMSHRWSVAVRGVARCCRVLLGVAGCCWVLPGVAGCCWVLQGVAGCCWCCRVLQGVAGCCRVLQGAAGCCRVGVV